MNPELKNRNSIEAWAMNEINYVPLHKSKQKNSLKYSNLLWQGAESCVEIPYSKSKKKKTLKKSIGKSIDNS